MKQIYVDLRLDGTSIPNSKVLNFQSENLATRVTFNYPKEYNGYTKQIDIYVGKTRQTDFKVLSTEDTVYIDLNDEYLQAGYLSLQPIAYLGDIKIKFDVLKIPVHKSLDVLKSDTSTTPSVAENLQAQIDELKIIKLDVYINNLQDGDLIVFNSANNRFENKHLSLSDFIYGN